MRLFIAILFDDALKDQILEIQTLLREKALRGNFTRPENLHLTLIFLGETPGEQVPGVREALEELREEPFSLEFSRVGAFRRSGKELWWIGAREGPSLERLQGIREDLARGLGARGISFDNRPFNAHITLGREIRTGERETIPAHRIPVPVHRVSLILSEQQRGLRVYRELHGKELRTP